MKDRAARIKSLVKLAIDRFPRPLPRPSDRALVLCYHSVHPSKPYASVSPDLFSDHLEWLRENCTVIPFEDIQQQRPENELDRPRVAITFDDGYADNHEFVLPLLTRHGLRATFFITTGLVDRQASVRRWFGVLRNTAAGTVDPLNWTQLMELRDEGMRVGSHTWSHINLARASEDRVKLELTTSRHTLEDRLGIPVRALAYPFGKPRIHFTRQTVSLARQSGYVSAAAVLFRGVRPSDDSMLLPRFFVAGDSVGVLQAKVMGRWDPIGFWQEHGPKWLTRIVSPADFRV